MRTLTNATQAQCRVPRVLPARNASLVGKTAWSAVASFVSLAGRLVASIIIARSLGTEGVGRIAYFVWIVEMANVLTNLGLRTSMTRFLAELGGQEGGKRARDFAGWIYRRYLLLSLVGVCAVGIVTRAFASSDDSTAIWMLLALLFLARGLQLVYLAYLTGIQRFDILARINVFAGVSLVSGMGIGVYFFGLPGALGGYIVGSLLPALCSFSLLRGSRTASLLDARLRRRVWKYAIYTWLATIVSAFVWSRMEIFFIKLYWTDHDVAMFSVGLTFAALISQAAMMLSGAFLPHFAELSGNGADMSRISSTYASGTRLLALVLFPMAFGGAAIMPIALPMLYGSEFAPAVPNAMVLIAASGLLFSKTASSLAFGLERSLFIAVGGFAGAAVALVGSVLIIPTWGAWGAVWLRTAVQFGMVLLGMWYVSYRIGVSVPLGALMRTLCAAVLCGIAAWALASRWDDPIVLTVAIPVGAVVYLCAVRKFKVISPRDTPHLERVLTSLPASISKRACFVLKWAEGTP